jgi:hypothetical protein
MTNEGNSARAGQRVRTHTIVTVAILLAVVVAVGLSWQLYRYNGLMSLLAEWQYDTFGRFFSTATIVIIIMLVDAPLLVVLISRSTKARTEQLLKAEPMALLVRAKLAYRQFLAVGAAVLLVALSILTYGRSIDLEPTVQRYLAADQSQSSTAHRPALDEVILRLDRVAQYQSNSLFSDRTVNVAPLQSAPNEPITFFVEVGTEKPLPSRTIKLSGNTAPLPLPGPLRRLYRDSGFRVSDNAVLLVASRENVRMPYVQTARILCLAALVLIAIGIAEFYWYRVLNRQIKTWAENSTGAVVPFRRYWWPWLN